MWPAHVSKMARCVLWFMTCAGLLTAEAAGAELQLSVSDPRPVAKAIQILSDRHGLVVTYEDPPYAFEGETLLGSLSRPPLPAIVKT
jgi:hypothetical protein